MDAGSLNKQDNGAMALMDKMRIEERKHND